MIRSAQSCNVFWKVGTSATLGAGSTFRGTIMAHTSISLGAAVTVDGRLLAGEQASGAGAVTLINDTIIVPTCAAPVTTTAATTTTTATGTTTEHDDDVNANRRPLPSGRRSSRPQAAARRRRQRRRGGEKAAARKAAATKAAAAKRGGEESPPAPQTSSDDQHGRSREREAARPPRRPDRLARCSRCWRCWGCSSQTRRAAPAPQQHTAVRSDAGGCRPSVPACGETDAEAQLATVDRCLRAPAADQRTHGAAGRRVTRRRRTADAGSASGSRAARTVTRAGSSGRVPSSGAPSWRIVVDLSLARGDRLPRRSAGSHVLRGRRQAVDPDPARSVLRRGVDRSCRRAKWAGRSRSR